MVKNHLLLIYSQFSTTSNFINYIELNSGHINDTYLISTDSKLKYILQKINTSVFKNAKEVIKNKVLISNHLHNSSSPFQTLTFIKSKNNTYYYIDNQGNYWNMMLYIANSKTLETTETLDLAFEAGKLYGDFLNYTSSIKFDEIVETLPMFHDISHRFSQFEDALLSTSNSLKDMTKSEIEFAIKNFEFASQLSKATTLFPMRITHNDTKLSNILFDKNNKGLAVIDLDTVMPGIVHNDFGDSIRSICSDAKEDELNLENVSINLEYLEAYCKGYAQSIKSILTKDEIAYLPQSIASIIYIMGLRFLTDFLNKNIYYKITYPNHNLDRAKNQFTLYKDVIKKFDEITSIIFDAFNFK